MAIPFTQIPANLLVPGQYQEIDNSLAGSQGDIKKALIIATKTAAGTATAGKAVAVMSAGKAGELFGYGSPAAIMADSFLKINKAESLFVLPLTEPAVGTVWKKEFTVAANNAAAGAINIFVNGKKTAAAVTAGLAADRIAAGIVAAINSLEGSFVEASVDGTTNTKIILAAKTKGLSGNSNQVAFGIEAIGVTITAGTVTTATGAPDVSTLDAMLGSIRYNYIACEYSDQDFIKKLSDELDSRYSALRQIGGRAFITLSGTVGSVSDPATILGRASKVNSPHLCLVPHIQSLDLPFVWAAAFAATACRILADDPSANTYDTLVRNVSAEIDIDFDTRQKLLESGVSTWRIDPAGRILIERLVTSYTENSDGGRDTSYLDIQVVETVDAVRTYINAEAKKRFKTWKLAATEENFGRGAKVMTHGVWRSFLADLYQTVFIQEKNWCQDFEAYKNSIEVEVLQGSKTRLQYLHQPVLIGQFLIGAGLNQFK